MKIGQLVARSGLTAHTIRYYERIGLLPYADRDQSGQRDYEASILTWIEFLGRLKATGMPIREMLRYAELRDQGPASEAARRELLERHRVEVRAKLAELSESLLVLDAKIAGYAGTSKRMKDYDRALPERRKRPAASKRAAARW